MMDKITVSGAATEAAAPQIAPKFEAIRPKTPTEVIEERFIEVEERMAALELKMEEMAEKPRGWEAICPSLFENKPELAKSARGKYKDVQIPPREEWSS